MKAWTVSFEDKRVHGFFTKEQAYQIGRAWSLRLGCQVELRQHGAYRDSVGIVDAMGITEGRKRGANKMPETI